MINSRGYSISKDDTRIPSEGIEKALIVKPMVYSTGGGRKGFRQSENDKFSVYRESTKRYYMPRVYGIEKYGKPTHDMFEGRYVHLDDNVCEFKGDLREHQIESVSRIQKNYSSVGSCLLCLPCGYGKTCVAIHMISKMKVKTLVVVHKEFLMTQWAERIQEFLPNARIGYIQQNKCDIEDKDVVLAMLQSVSMRDYDKSVFDGFGQLILDECHHIAARAFSNAMFKVQCKYMLGLSATPERADGLTILLKWFLGEFEIPVSRPKNYTVHVDIVKNPTLYDLQDQLPGGAIRKASMAGMITKLGDDLERNKLLLDKLESVIKDTPKRKVIILSDRREHLTYLHKQITTRTNMKKENSSLSGMTCGMYIGGMKKQDLKESEDCDIIVSTYSMTSEGFDIPSLNTLFLSTPKSNIEQSVGRILRKSSDINPLVVDTYDNHELLEGMYRKRIRFYKKNGYAIDYGDNRPGGRVFQGGVSIKTTQNSVDKQKNTLDKYAFNDDY